MERVNFSLPILGTLQPYVTMTYNGNR